MIYFCDCTSGYYSCPADEMLVHITKDGLILEDHENIDKSCLEATILIDKPPQGTIDENLKQWIFDEYAKCKEISKYVL